MMLDNGEMLRTSVYLRAIPRQSDYGVYHGIYGGLCLVDQGTVDLLHYFEAPNSTLGAIREGRLTSEQAEAFVPFFTSKRLLVPATFDEEQLVADRQRRRKQDLATGRQIRTLQLILANRCNLRCEYCFEGLGGTPLAQTVYAHSSPERIEAQSSAANVMMTGEKAEAYLKAVIEMVRCAGNNALAVQFFGGEPLVNWQAMRHVLSHFGSGCDAVALAYSVVTNGSIVTEEMARAFRDFQVSVIVSYDSPKGESRPLPGGKKSHDVIRRGIDLLKRYGNRLALNSTITIATFDLFDHDLVDFAFDHGVYEIGVILDLDPLFYAIRSTDEIADKLWDVYIYGKSKGVVLTGYWHQIFQGLADEDRYGQIGYQNCPAMGVQFSIEPSGAVFACKASGAYFGNILQITDLLRSGTYRKYAMRACISPERCRNCEIQYFCGGLCLGALENKYRGDIWSVEDNTCDLYRRVTRHFITNATARQTPVFHLLAQ